MQFRTTRELINQRPDMANEQWARELHKYYGQRPYWETERLRGEPISPREGIERETPGMSEGTKMQVPANRAHRVIKAEHDLIGREVQGTSKLNLGKVEDLLLDEPSGHVAFVVVRFNDPGKIDSQAKDNKQDYAALPWQVFNWDNSRTGEKSPVVLNIGLDRIKGQLFKSDQWPDLNNHQWAEGVYRHFGLQPRFEHHARMGQGNLQGRATGMEGTPGSEGTEGGTEQGTQGGDQGTSGEPQGGGEGGY